MVTLHGTARTFATTKSPIFIVSLRFLKKCGSVTFKNGSKFKITWSQFLMLRDSYQYWSKYALDQVGNDLFKLKQDEAEFTGDLTLISSILSLTEKHKFTVKPNGSDTFSLNGAPFNLVGSSGMLFVVNELFYGSYACDCSGKTVLDIGGFEGETAAYFASRGAKKVVLYEPIPLHFETAKQNVERNNINAELHNAGIADADGTITIEFLSGKNTCPVKNVASVLLESEADIAKIDCEGAEESLVNVSNEVLRRISLYMIELHSQSIRQKILEKFTGAGFTLTQEFSWANDCLSVVHLTRDPKKNTFS